MKFYNCSVYDATATSGAIFLKTNAAPSNITAVNCVHWAPNATGYDMLQVDAQVDTAATNSSDAEVHQVTAVYGTNPPTTVSEFTPADYAVAGGTEVNVWLDALQNLRHNNGTKARPSIDMGAVQTS